MHYNLISVTDSFLVPIEFQSVFSNENSLETKK